MSIVTHEINFSPDRVEHLLDRVDHIDWPHLPFDTGWQTGADANLVKSLAEYWAGGYDWVGRQSGINDLPQFRAEYGTRSIHFLHYSQHAGATRFPIVLLHGWPGSFLLYADAAPLLFKGVAGSRGYDLVIPTLPGFPFSEVVSEDDCYYRNAAAAIHRLMLDLGYERYAVSGGDWGWLIAREIAIQFPENVVGLHIEHVMAVDPLPAEGRTDEERAYLRMKRELKTSGLAYNQLQSTKPLTVSYALQDSPVGFLAWITEKFWEWTDHEANLLATVDRDVILDTAMLYLLSGSVYSSAMIYYVNNTKHHVDLYMPPISTPTRCSCYRGDPFEAVPESLVDRKHFINADYVFHETGGHFPSLELPTVWAADLLDFLSAL